MQSTASLNLIELFSVMIFEIFSACLGAAGGVQPGRDDGGQRLRDYDNLPLQGEDQDKLSLTFNIQRK